MELTPRWIVDQSDRVAVNDSVDLVAVLDQVLQEFANNIRIFYRCDDPNATTALFTLLYINGKDSLEPLRPGHRIGLRFRALLVFYR